MRGKYIVSLSSSSVQVLQDLANKKIKNSSRKSKKKQVYYTNITKNKFIKSVFLKKFLSKKLYFFKIKQWSLKLRR